MANIKCDEEVFYKAILMVSCGSLLIKARNDINEVQEILESIDIKETAEMIEEAGRLLIKAEEWLAKQGSEMGIELIKED